MTSEVRRSLQAAAGVFVCIVAIGFGAVLRDKVELSGTKLDISNLVASRTGTTELPETKFFDDIMDLLKKKYVDPINDDRKLADGAVRGMVASLGDPNSLFMDPEQFKVYDNVRKGKYEGIGADVVLVRDRPQGKVQISGEEDSDEGNSRLPKLMIAAVVPGSAADRAGLKAGDWAEFVDDHWIPNSDALDRFEKLFNDVKAHTAKVEDFVKMRKQLRDEEEKHILPIKARDRLMIGAAGTVRTVWVRGDKRITAILGKGEWQMPAFGKETDGAIRLPFVADSAAKLKEALSGKTEATIDLRGNVEGDFDAMTECLDVVAPKGTYGFLVTRRSEKPSPLIVKDGSSAKLKLTLLVDRTTRGVSEIFALALSSRGLAKLSGPPTAGNQAVVRWFALPDGAGYSLVTSEYRPNAPSGALARAPGSVETPFQHEALSPTAGSAIAPDKGARTR